MAWPDKTAQHARRERAALMRDGAIPEISISDRPLPEISLADGAAIPGDSAGDGAPVVRSPLAVLLTGHLIPDNEVVILLLKPSLLFIPLVSLMTLGFAALIGVSGTLFARFLPGSPAGYVNLAILIAAVRLMWATLQWMGRYYILTDLRVMTLSGVFQTTVYECPLRRVARVRLLRSLRDGAIGLGHVEIIPQEESMAVGVWETVSKPKAVKERLQRAVARAKSFGRGA